MKFIAEVRPKIRQINAHWLRKSFRRSFILRLHNYFNHYLYSLNTFIQFSAKQQSQNITIIIKHRNFHRILAWDAWPLSLQRISPLAGMQLLQGQPEKFLTKIFTFSEWREPLRNVFQKRMSFLLPQKKHIISEIILKSYCCQSWNNSIYHILTGYSCTIMFP